MYFVALFLALIAVLAAVSRVYATHTFDGVEYSATLSTGEVFEDEDIFLYEEITNNKTLPLPCVRVDTDLPDGLRFRLHKKPGGGEESNLANTPKRKKTGPVTSRGVKKAPAVDSSDEYLRGYVQSIFALHSRRKISRRWRIACQKRGEYAISGTMLVSTDPLGLNTQSKRVEAASVKRSTVTVLPKPINLTEHFTASYHPNGDRTIPIGLLSDPLRIAGSREYTPLDPMSKINWLSTASHNKLMVNVEEFTERHRFGLLLNMQSRGREHDPQNPSDPASVELCVTVCASIFDMISQDNVPITLYANAPLSESELNDANLIAVGDGTIIKTRPYTGRGEMIDALRLLAVLPMKISCQTEKMLDAVCADPLKFADGGNLIVVSSYIDERMINFHSIMRQNGVRVVFYITTANQNASFIPDDIEVWFKTYR
jgi:Uncharacterized conserved protein (some members contain a von Willebrand factor type A (vWA) domain)